MDIPVSPEVQVLTGTVTFNAIGQLKPLKDAPFFVRSVSLNPGDSNTGIIRAAQGGGSARLIPVPIYFAPIEGKMYDLNKLIVEAIDVAADTVVWVATR